MDELDGEVAMISKMRPDCRSSGDDSSDMISADDVKIAMKREEEGYEIENSGRPLKKGPPGVKPNKDLYIEDFQDFS